MPKCQYEIAHEGSCDANCADRFCTVHQQVTCSVCYEQATHEYAHAWQVICGGAALRQLRRPHRHLQASRWLEIS